jgi:hypothetical protein
MMKHARAAAVLLTAVALSLAAAGPARAGGTGSPTPPPVGTGGCNGPTCSVGLGQISVTGDTGGPGGSFPPIDVPPPPCIWNPIGDATTGSALIIAAATGFGFLGVALLAPFVSQAEALLQKPVPGEWYVLTNNPSDDAAAAAACEKEPPFVWVPAGETPPVPPIPPVILARFAYNKFTIPLPRLRISPPRKGIVNLATYVWANWPASKTTGQEDLYQVSARLGNTVVTVQARAQSISITAIGPGTVFSTGCGPNGSRFPVGSPPATAGAGTPPDCGVLWNGPDAHAGITATATWSVTWWANDGVVHTLPNISVTSHQANIAVSEIEGINGQ